MIKQPSDLTYNKTWDVHSLTHVENGASGQYRLYESFAHATAGGDVHGQEKAAHLNHVKAGVVYANSHPERAASFGPLEA